MGFTASRLVAGADARRRLRRLQVVQVREAATMTGPAYMYEELVWPKVLQFTKGPKAA